MIFELKDLEKVAPLFEGWQETMIWSCLQNVMGKIYTDSLENPVSAMALLADFCFFAGKPDAELVQHYGQGARMNSQTRHKPAAEIPWGIIMVPQNREWGALIESCYGKRAKKTIRFAIKKEPDIFNKEKLQEAVNALPAGYILKMMDEKLFWQCRDIPWCRDWVSQYPDYDMYRKCGLGAIALKDEEPVSGASSYTSYHGGIEVEIDTREDHRRKGLAYSCGAKLILECLERGWYPSWDAQNRWSVALAEKLGYHFDHEYTAYEVRNCRK